jgi:hypothetical protein
MTVLFIFSGKEKFVGEISGSHGGEYEDDGLLEYCVMP